MDKQGAAALWEKASQLIKSEINSVSYDYWFQDLQPADWDGEKLTLMADNDFGRNLLKEKYDELADYLQAVLAELSSPLLGIGIALPVDVDSDTGRIISAFNISGNDCQCVEEKFRYLADKLGLACCQIWQRRCSTLK